MLPTAIATLAAVAHMAGSAAGMPALCTVPSLADSKFARKTFPFHAYRCKAISHT